MDEKLLAAKVAAAKRMLFDDRHEINPSLHGEDEANFLIDPKAEHAAEPHGAPEDIRGFEREVVEALLMSEELTAEPLTQHLEVVRGMLEDFWRESGEQGPVPGAREAEGPAPS